MSWQTSVGNLETCARTGADGVNPENLSGDDQSIGDDHTVVDVHPPDIDDKGGGNVDRKSIYDRYNFIKEIRIKFYIRNWAGVTGERSTNC